MLKYNDEILISGGADKKVRVWSIINGFTCKTLVGHQSDINTLCDVSTELIASGSSDNTIRVNIKFFN